MSTCTYRWRTRSATHDHQCTEHPLVVDGVPPWPLHTCTVCRLIDAERASTHEPCAATYALAGHLYDCGVISPPGHALHVVSLYDPAQHRESAIAWDAAA